MDHGCIIYQLADESAGRLGEHMTVYDFELW
jgi:hypothetical protein